MSLEVKMLTQLTVRYTKSTEAGDLYHSDWLVGAFNKKIKLHEEEIHFT